MGGLHRDLRTLLSNMDSATTDTIRQIQHMRYLQHFQNPRWGSFDIAEIEKIMSKAGPDPELELPGAPLDEGSSSEGMD